MIWLGSLWPLTTADISGPQALRLKLHSRVEAMIDRSLGLSDWMSGCPANVCVYLYLYCVREKSNTHLAWRDEAATLKAGEHVMVSRLDLMACLKGWFRVRRKRAPAESKDDKENQPGLLQCFQGLNTIVYCRGSRAL